MSSNNRKMNMTKEAMTFVNDVDNQPKFENQTATKDQTTIEQDKAYSEARRIDKLKSTAKHLYLPDDPAYVQISDDLLAVNELGRGLDASTKVMINVALGDYAVFRKKPVDDANEETLPEPVKLNFKRVYFEDFERYQDVQDELDDMNRRINLLTATNGGGTLDGLDKLKEYKVEAKKVILKKIDIGLEVFFKKSDIIRKDVKHYDYNDELFNIEIGVFRYTRAPFLRQISSNNTS